MSKELKEVLNAGLSEQSGWENQAVCVISIIDAAIRDSPDVIALSHRNEALTYRELDRMVQSRASVLAKSGLRAHCGMTVALIMATGIEYIVCMLAVLRAGGAYIPLSPSLPAARIERMLRQASCSLALVDDDGKRTAESLDEHIARIDISQLDSVAAIDAGRASPAATDLACILFTSGSSGDPKGVRTTHGNLGSYARWCARFFADTAASCVPLTTAPHYAAATSQIFACLCAGGTLEILDNVLGQPARLLDFYARHPEHALHTVPTVWRTLLDHLERGETGRPAVLFLSGEHLSSELLERTFAFDPALPVWNLYGPTEAVANISAGRLERGAPVVIGKPLPDARLFVVDENGLETGDRQEGRLLISGPNVCPGYLGVTASASFFMFTDSSGERHAVYDTGDHARRLGDDIELLGRRDGQIKLRGVRIELAEVETHVLRHPGVAHAAVLFADDPEPRLVAFVEARPDQVLTAHALVQHLRLSLPASMLPECWSLQTIPLLPNGKIDRATLRGQLASVVARSAIRPPEEDAEGQPVGATECSLAEVFSTVLNLRKPGRDDDFFALGGNSLDAYRLLAEIERRFGERISFSVFYAEPTIRGLAKLLPAEQRDKSSPAVVTDRRLSRSQHGLWLQQQAHPESVAHHLCYRIDFTAGVDARCVRDAIARLGERHVLLRCRIETQGGEVLFREDAERAEVFDVIDHSLVPEGERDAALEQMLRSFAVTVFAEKNVLHRWRLVLLGDGRQVLLFVVHHLIFDGVSATLLFDELRDLLEGTASLPTPGDYFQFVAQETQYLQAAAHTEDVKFWSRQLEGRTSQPAFPVSYKLPGQATSAGGRLRFRLSHEEREALAKAARRENVTLHVFLLTMLAVVLDRFDPGADFLVAVPFANRLRAADQRTVGYLAAVLFYRLQWQPGVPVRALCARLQQDTISLLDHQRIPFPELVMLLREGMSVLPSSTFRLMFGYHDITTWRSEGFQAQEYFSGQVKCDLHPECFDDGDTLEIVLSYRHSALDDAAAQDWLDCFRSVLQGVDQWLDAIPEHRPALTAHEIAQVLRPSRGESVPQALERSLPELFRDMAARYPDAPALWFKGEEISYAALAVRVTAVVHWLRNDAAASSGPIGVCMPHQPSLLVALLACAETGLPYVPLDPSLPVQRIGAIMEQAGIRLLLSGDGSPDIPLPNGIACVDLARPGFPSSGEDSSGVVATPDSLLYIIYTSGSTGTPKGVMIPQRGVANYLQWMKACFDAGPHTRILAKTSISFDISTWELLLPLISGGCTVLPQRVDVQSPEGIARIAADSGVNVMQFVPSGLSLFMEAGMLPEVPGVRQIFCGGEALPPALVERIVGSGWRGALHNLYGPTEASIFMACHSCNAASPYRSVPIGKPIQNASLYVLDAQRRLLPPNVAGDLYIGGAVLANGYWRNPEKTRKAFIDAPPGLPETRLYRTGDRGRLLSDGSFEYLGREDDQIKIRGYRVELGEIEQHLRAHPDVFDTAVFTQQRDENDLRLHAVIVMCKDTPFDAAGLLAWLKARLPAWMLPSTLSCVSDLPRLTSGKVDREGLRALVKPQSAELRPSVPSGAERDISAVWQAVLGHAQFHLHDSFFNVGGHSMLLMTLRERLRECLGVEFSIADLFGAPNIAEQAAALRRKLGQSIAQPIIATVRERISRRQPNQP